MIALAIIVTGIAAWFASTFVALSMDVSTDRLWGTFAILMFVALVIERATEVYVEPQSDPRSAALKSELAAIRAKKDELMKAMPLAAPGMPTPPLPPELVGLTATETERAGELATIDKQTQRRALAITIPLSLVVALAGVRTIGGLLPPLGIADAGHAPGTHDMAGTATLFLDFYQYCLLAVVDVLLTAGLLAGGADGIHKVLDRYIKLAANKPT